jgi:hypothetical protein
VSAIKHWLAYALELKRPSCSDPSDILDTKRPPTDLREVIRDLMSIEDQEAASRRLAEKLVSFS